jgi:hypothetical protein
MRRAERGRSHGRLPPYGREILDLRERGLIPVGRMFVALDTWSHGKSYARVVVTPDLDPSELDFTFLAGLDVELVWLPEVTSVERRDAAIRAILRCLPERLMLWTAGGDVPRLTWIKSNAVGVELQEFA